MLSFCEGDGGLVLVMLLWLFNLGGGFRIRRLVEFLFLLRLMDICYIYYYISYERWIDYFKLILKNKKI